MRLGPGLGAALRELAKARQCTLYMTLLAGFAAFLSRLTGGKDLVVGTPAANRNREDIEGVIGFFVNSLALRLRLEDAQPFESLVESVRETVLKAFVHQEYPFDRLIDLLKPARDMRMPILSVMFALPARAAAWRASTWAARWRGR